MAERISALAHSSIGRGGRHPAEAPRFHLSHPRPGSIIQIAAWPDTLRTVRATIANLVGMEAAAVGHATTAKGLTIASVAHGRFLISTDAAGLAERFSALRPEDGAVTDLSHARAIIRMTGRDLEEIAAQFVAIDLDARAFPVGRVAQTAIHHIDVMIHHAEPMCFDFWVLRSFTESLAEWLSYGDVEWLGLSRIR